MTLQGGAHLRAHGGGDEHVNSPTNSLHHHHHRRAEVFDLTQGGNGFRVRRYMRYAAFSAHQNWIICDVGAHKHVGLKEAV